MTLPARCARSSDIPALRNIWASAFGEGDETSFFNHYFNPELCVVADQNGSPSAAGYLIPFGDAICVDITVPCAIAMIYAVAVLPDCRNSGLGGLVVRGLISLGQSLGYHAIVLCPSDDGLFGYYSARSDLQDMFFVAERRFTEIPPPPSSASSASAIPSAGLASLFRVSADDYAKRHESLLDGTPHINMNRDALLFQELLCKQAGGGLYHAAAPGGEACAVIERQSNGDVWIKELLTRGDCEKSVLASIAAEYPANEYLARSPASALQGCNGVVHEDDPPDAPRDGLRIRRFGMISAEPGIITAMTACDIRPWYGLAFD